MDYAKTIEAISKISTFESVIVIGLLAIGYIFYHLSNKNFKWQDFLIFAGSILGVLFMGAYITVKRLGFSEKEMVDLQKNYSKIINDRDSLKLSNQKNEILKDTCYIEKQRMSLQNDTLKNRKEFWKEKFQTEYEERKRLSNEIKKYTGHKYKYCGGYALIRDPDSGLHGYHKKGTPESSIKYLYDSGTKFSEGRAFVKYKGSEKWGLIDQSLGVPFVNCIFEKPFAFNHGKAKVIYNGKEIFIDKTGNKIGTKP